MDPLNPNNPIANGSQFPPPEPPRSNAGPLAGAAIVIVLLVAGGLYFWGAKLNRETMNNDIPFIPDDSSTMYEEQPVGELQSDTSAGLPPQSSSDDVSSIESDFNAMDMNELESQNSAEMNNI